MPTDENLKLAVSKLAEAISRLRVHAQKTPEDSRKLEDVGRLVEEARKLLKSRN